MYLLKVVKYKYYLVVLITIISLKWILLIYAMYI